MKITVKALLFLALGVVLCSTLCFVTFLPTVSAQNGCKPGVDPFTGLFVACAGGSVGPTGPTGATGATGTTGPTGPTGAAAIGTQTFLISGTFTPAAAITRVWVQVWGGGGGGAGGTTATNAGSGGGGGGYAEGWCATTPASGVTVTIGAGGLAGAVGAVGGSGGNSSFGSCLTATGALAQATTAAVATGGYDNRWATLIAVPNVSPLLYSKNTVAPTATASGACAASAGANPAWIPIVDSTGGCGAVGPVADNAGTGGGVANKAGGGGGSGALGAATTRAAGAGGLSAWGGNGGAGDGVTNGTPNATCVAGTQPGGGGGGGAANASTRSAGCAGAAGEVIVWW